MNHSYRPHKEIFKFLFFLALFFMPMDGFYWGMLVLREFGARPLNFILLLVGLIFLLTPKIGNEIFKNEKNLLFLVVLILTLVSFNIFVPVFNDAPSVMGRSPLIQWSFQYLTIIWFFISIYIWVFWFENLQIIGRGYKWFLTTLILSTLSILIVFYYDFFIRILAGGPVEDFLYLLKGKIDWRASGLSTEPSIFGSWALLIWPLLLFADKKRAGLKRLGKISHIVGYLCIFSALISGARTFIVIFLFQGIIFLFSILKKRKFMGTLGLLGLVAVCITAWNLPFFPERIKLLFTSSLECSEIDCSTMTRLASALTALNIFWDHPWSGVGLGQFTSYFGGYVPAWALSSLEVKDFITENISQRVNAFNLFARIGAEMGIALLLFFLAFFYRILKPLYKKIKLYQNDKVLFKFYMGFFLSSIGGISWWFTQDLFTYQPGIFSLAIAIYLKSILTKGFNPNPIYNYSSSPSQTSQIQTATAN